MGSLQSTLTPDQIISGGAIAATVAVGAMLYVAKPPGQEGSEQAEAAKKASSRKRKSNKTGGLKGTDSSMPSPLAVPGALLGSGEPATSSKSEDNVTPEEGDAAVSESKANLTVPSAQKKKQKRKAKSVKSGDDSEATPEPPSPSAAASSSKKGSTGKNLAASNLGASMMDASWTRVDARRSGASASSDAGVTTTGDEDHSSSADVQEEHLTLAERLLPKLPKTHVDDMLPPGPGLARVMRIGTPVSDTPAGISWRDYEDADELHHSTDGDGDDEGWGIVQGKKPRIHEPEPTYPSTVTDAQQAKRQRQREAKRDASKSFRAEGEEERLATLAKHNREKDRARMEEQERKKVKGKAAKVSGGMTGSVQNGQLVWE